MIQRIIIEGIKNILRSFWLSATAISVLTVNLASVVIVASSSTFVGYSVRNLDKYVSFPAFIQDTYKEEDIPKLIEKIKSIPEVKEVEYFDKEKASKELTESSGKVNLDVIKNNDSDYKNLVWRFVLITPENSESYSKVLEKIKSNDFEGVWKEVVGSENFVDNLINIYSWINIISWFLIVIFGLISALVMFNILRMTIYNHKDEIEIMRLVGATNNYIRMPFVVEGIIYSIISSFIVTIFFSILARLFLSNTITWLVSSNAINDLNNQIYYIFGITLLSATIFSAITSYMATTKYLKL